MYAICRTFHQIFALTRSRQLCGAPVFCDSLRQGPGPSLTTLISTTTCWDDFTIFFTAYFLDGSCAVRRDALQAWTDSNEQCEIWTGLLMVMDSWTSKLLEPNMPYIKWLKSTGWRCNYQKHSGFLTLDISQLYKLVSFLPEAMLSLRSIDHSFTLCECI